MVRIQCDADEGSDIFLFRWEGGDFRLIGGKEDRHKSEADYDISYNYLTGKMIRTDGKGKSRKSQTLDMPKQPKILFGWIPLEYSALGYLVETPEMEEDPLSPDDMLAWGIFRVMQANEMLFWHFCDWENPYHDLHPDGDEGEGFWYADDEHMSPGSYNAWSSLSIQKLADGSYDIDLTESFYDRSYEALFDEDMSNIDEVMEVVKISDVESRVIRNLSKGYRQRVGLAAALLGNPPVLILDEPTVGLDPKQIIDIRKLIKSLGKKHTIIFSSHVLSEVSAVCDRIVMINNGKIVADAATDKLSEAISGDGMLALEVDGATNAVRDAIGSVEGVKRVTKGAGMSYTVEYESGTDVRRGIFNALAKAGCPILMMRSGGLTLEESFLKLTEGGEN